MNAQPEHVRVDKWLWAARFFKTRGLASEAIQSGRVKVNEERAKPAREVRAGRGQPRNRAIASAVASKSSQSTLCPPGTVTVST